MKEICQFRKSDNRKRNFWLLTSGKPSSLEAGKRTVQIISDLLRRKKKHFSLHVIHVLLSSSWSDYTHNITSKNNNSKRKIWAGTLPPAARLLKHEPDFGRSHLPSNCHSAFWSGVGLPCKTQAFCLCLSTCTWRTKREATNACFL